MIDQRELIRTSPTLIWMMKSVPASISSRGSSLVYRPSDVEFVVSFDPGTGLPARVSTRDADNVEGDSSYDLVLSDWRDVSGVKIAHRQSYELNGREVIRIQLDEAQVNPAVIAAQLEVPSELRATAAKPATGKVPYQGTSAVVRADCVCRSASHSTATTCTSATPTRSSDSRIGGAT